MLESWLTLMQACPRQFQLRKAVVEELVTYSLPCAAKRMTERQLAQVGGWRSGACRGRAGEIVCWAGEGPAGAGAGGRAGLGSSAARHHNTGPGGQTLNGPFTCTRQNRSAPPPVPPRSWRAWRLRSRCAGARAPRC